MVKAQRARKTILIVEDDDKIRDCLKLFCLGLPLSIWEEKNGELGLHSARELKPDLIITDISMPVMDGIELTKELRADVVMAKCPILVFTGTSYEEQRNARKAGANMVLEKPVSRRVFVEVLQNLLKWEAKAA